MKLASLLFTLISLTFCNAVFAQDKLLLRNGDEMMVKVLEITPDSLIFTQASDSAAVKAASISKNAVFSITYQGGKKDLMPEPRYLPAPLSEEVLYATGRAEARQLYKANGTFWATFATSAALPIGGPLLGIPTGVVLSAVNVNEKYIRASDPAYKQSPSYLKGYQKQAKLKKAGNAAAGVGAGTAFAVGLVMVLITTVH